MTVLFPPLVLQALLRNGAESADLWGLVTKGRISFCLILEGNNLNWWFMFRKAFLSCTSFLPSRSEVHAGQQGWHLIVIYSVFLLGETALCYRPVGRYLFYLILINAEQNYFQRKRPFTPSFCSELVYTEVHNPSLPGQGAIGNIGLEHRRCNKAWYSTCRSYWWGQNLLFWGWNSERRKVLSQSHQTGALYNPPSACVDHFACVRWLCTSWDDELQGYKWALNLAMQI